jgi:hypothetical protein
MPIVNYMQNSKQEGVQGRSEKFILYTHYMMTIYCRTLGDILQEHLDREHTVISMEKQMKSFLYRSTSKVT